MFGVAGAKFIRRWSVFQEGGGEEGGASFAFLTLKNYVQILRLTIACFY